MKSQWRTPVRRSALPPLLRRETLPSVEQRPSVRRRVLCCAAGQNIRKLVKDGFVIQKPQKVHSRARTNAWAEAKRKASPILSLIHI